MEAYGQALKTFVETTGPAGAIIAAVLVGLALAVIFFARTAGLFQGARAEDSRNDFVEGLVARVAKLETREEELYRDLERNEAENRRLRDQQGELKTQLALLRIQLRRYIDLLRAVREGRLPPSAIEAADTVEPVS